MSEKSAFDEKHKLRKTVLVVAQTPPPVHGQSVMNQLLLDGDYRSIELRHVRMAFSEEISEVGGFRWKKIFHLATLILQIAWNRLRWRTSTLYYPPASPNMVPFLRDCAILIATRWMFRHTVFHFHANGISDLFKALPLPIKLLYRLAYSKPQVCICLTKIATQDALQFQARSISIVPNGIPDVAAPIDAVKSSRAPEQLTILFLATISIEKGAGVLLKAAEILKCHGISFHCVMAGPFASKEDERNLTALSRKLGVDDIVMWRGAVFGEAKWNVYRQADIFCFPTFYRTEGFPVVLLEAMMFGLPVLSTNWRGIPDIVDGGKTGFLVPINDFHSVALRLQQLMQDSELRRSMGRAGRRRYEQNFTIEKFRKHMEEVLASVRDSY